MNRFYHLDSLSISMLLVNEKLLTKEKIVKITNGCYHHVIITRAKSDE